MFISQLILARKALSKQWRAGEAPCLGNEQSGGEVKGLDGAFQETLYFGNSFRDGNSSLLHCIPVADRDGVVF